MENTEKSYIYSPVKQTKLYCYESLLNFFIEAFNKDLLPNKILLSGKSGIGKETFAYHLINFILSKDEKYSYDIKNLEINSLNKSFKLINQNCHPNFFLIENLTGKSSINIEQVRNMINYANKTAYNNKKKFILINNSEFLNLNSINALLKIVEEPGSNTNFILIHNSSNIISKTLKSRCIEFKVFFDKSSKNKILNKILSQYQIDFDPDLIDKIISYYDTPGTILNILDLIDIGILDKTNINLQNIISKLIEYNLKNRNNSNLTLLQNIIEIFYYKKLSLSENKNVVLKNYSNTLKQIDLFKRYNTDLGNVFYEIKQNIIHG